MKTVLITGVAGLLGSRLADWIINNKPSYQIVGIDNLSGGYQQFIPQEIEFIEENLVSANLEKSLKDFQFNYVFHFAAYAAEGLSPFIRKYNYQNNLVATANVINYCINNEISRLVFTSSMAVYGYGSPPFDETHIPSPIDPYGIAKYACELDILTAHRQHGIEFCIIRPHNVYGKNQNIWDSYRNVLAIWMLQKLKNEKISIYGDGSQKRAFSYIDDCLESLWNAASSNMAKNEIINLGGVEVISIMEAAKTLSEVVGGVEFDFLSERHEVKNAYSTHKKSVELLGFSDQTNLYDGLASMWEWVKSMPKREQFKWQNYEIEKGLYEYWKK